VPAIAFSGGGGGVHGDAGRAVPAALGGSDRAGTAIGRALRLVLRNLMDVRPGDVDRSTLGGERLVAAALFEWAGPFMSVRAE
jgi:hypothetical protein